MRYSSSFCKGGNWLLSLFLLASTSMPARSQGSYHPLLQEGRQWNYSFESMNDAGNVIHFSEWVGGDSVVGGVTYAKVYASTRDATRLSMLMREEGAKVYALLPDSEGKTEKEVLMYDFGLREGDVFTSDDCDKYFFDVMTCRVHTMGDSRTFTVGRVDTVLVEGECRRRITILCDWGGMDGTPYVWVEGVGGQLGLTWPPFWNVCIDGKVCHFLSCCKDGKVVFTEGDFNQQAIALLRDGRSWTYATGHEWFGYHACRETVAGDTIIDGQTWKKVYLEDPIGSTPRFEKAMREEGSKVFLREGGGRQSLFMDFGAAVGDRFAYATPDEMGDSIRDLVVESTGTATLANGTTCRTLTLRQEIVYRDGIWPDTPYSYVHWTERYGEKYTGIMKSVQWCDIVGGVELELLLCRDGGEVLYDNTSAAAHYGLDIKTGVEALRKPACEEGAAIFDLQGRRLTQKPQRGLYIRDGRKVLAP